MLQAKGRSAGQVVTARGSTAVQLRLLIPICMCVCVCCVCAYAVEFTSAVFCGANCLELFIIIFPNSSRWDYIVL